MQLLNGLAAGAAVYPPALVRAVLQGIKDQMLQDGHLSSVETYTAGPVAEEPVLTEEYEEEFFDSVNGGYLDAVKVRAARQEEIDWVKSSDLYDVVPRSEATEKPIDLRWVDTDKGDTYRSRLVLRDIKARKRGQNKVLRGTTFTQLRKHAMHIT